MDTMPPVPTVAHRENYAPIKLEIELGPKQLAAMEEMRRSFNAAPGPELAPQKAPTPAPLDEAAQRKVSDDAEREKRGQDYKEALKGGNHERKEQLDAQLIKQAVELKRDGREIQDLTAKLNPAGMADHGQMLAAFKAADERYTDQKRHIDFPDSVSKERAQAYEQHQAKQRAIEDAKQPTLPPQQTQAQFARERPQLEIAPPQQRSAPDMPPAPKPHTVAAQDRYEELRRSMNAKPPGNDGPELDRNGPRL